MKGIIYLSDSKKRDSRVFMESKPLVRRTQNVNGAGHPVQSGRLVKGSLDTSMAALTADLTPEELSATLIEGDPEVDLELFGKRIEGTQRIYLTSKNEPAYGVRVKEQVYLANGDMKEERPLQVSECNVNLEKPLKWTGRLMPKEQFARKFAFAHVLQISHVDGLTYDFLYSMAKELEEKNALMFLAAGEKANEPLVLLRNGTSYRAFLEGRTDGDKYMLLMHLTNLELKALVPEEKE